MLLRSSIITDYGVDKYDIGTGFGHFAIASQDVSVVCFFLSFFGFKNRCNTHLLANLLSFFDILISILKVYKLVETIKEKGGTITREPGPVKGGSSVIAFAKDPDGYLFELIQRGPTPEPLCQVMLRVGDLERSIKFYEKVNLFFFLTSVNLYFNTTISNS